MKNWISKHPLIAICLPAVLALIIGLLVGRSVVSPEQVAADAGPPAETNLSTEVTKGKITKTLAVDGTIGFETTVEVAPSSGVEGEKPIVSALHVKVGDEVSVGKSIVDIGGRPTFVFEGNISSYRTLKPGASGPDVVQLQNGLRGLGYHIDSSEIVFGPQTNQAVSKFYSDRGYSPIEVGKEEVEAAQQSATQAQRAVDDADEALARAKRDYNKAKNAVPVEGETVEEPNYDTVEDAEKALERAKEDRDEANQKLSSAKAASGVQIPLGEVVFISSLPAKVSAVNLPVGKEIGDGKISLSAGSLSAQAFILEGQALEIPNSATATIVTSQGGEVPAKLIAKTPGVNRDDPDIKGFIIVVRPDSPIGAALDGEPARIRINLLTADEESLQVPESAIITKADGSTVVRVIDGKNEREVTVLLGESGDGQVAVSTQNPDDLKVGDLVLIGKSR